MRIYLADGKTTPIIDFADKMQEEFLTCRVDRNPSSFVAYKTQSFYFNDWLKNLFELFDGQKGISNIYRNISICNSETFFFNYFLQPLFSFFFFERILKFD